MRWMQPVEGLVRVRSRFLWFPRTIGGVTRWLERAKWTQEYTTFGPGKYSRGWIDCDWRDLEEPDAPSV